MSSKTNNEYDDKPPPYVPNPNYPPPYGQDAPRVVTTAPILTPQGLPQSYGSTTVVITQPTDNIIIVGGCPACRVGVLEDDFTCLGIFCAIFFFPIGILCCLALRNKRCTNCGAYFG